MEDDEIETGVAEDSKDFEDAFNEITNGSEGSDVSDSTEYQESEAPSDKDDGKLEDVQDAVQGDDSGNGSLDSDSSVPDSKDVKTGVEDKPRSVNNRNAQRRIRKKQRMEQKIADLEEKIRQYEKLTEEEKQSPSVQNAYDNLQNRLVDAKDDYNAEQYDTFADRIYNTFGEESAPKALRLIDRYARYVNNNEPDLLKMSQRPVIGDLLLVEWCTRMDNRSQRMQYMNLTPYEKSVYLSRLYDTIYRKVTEKNAPQGADNTPRYKDVPVAASGRDGGSEDSRNDFNQAWIEVLNQHKRSLKGM